MKMGRFKTMMHGNTPLHIACQNKCLRVVEVLCKGNLCNLGCQNSVGDTPLHIACATACFSVVDFLLVTQMERVEILAMQNNHGDIPFNLALELLQINVPKARCAKAHRTKAKARMHKKECRASLEFFANNCRDISFQNKDKETLLHLACRVKNNFAFQLVDFFVKSGADILKVDIRMQLPLHIAASQSLNMVEVCYLQDIANKQDIDGNTPLHIACLNEKYEIVQFLLDKKCNTQIRNGNKEIPLHCIFQNYDFTVKIRSKKMKERQKLIHLVSRYTGNICLQDSEGNTPLHLACKTSYVDWVKTLQQYIGHGDNISLQNNDGQTPLHIACSNSQLDMVQCLLKCDPLCKLIKDPCDTALHIACRENSHSMIDCLIEGGHGEATKISNTHGDLPLHLACKQVSLSWMLLPIIY